MAFASAALLRRPGRTLAAVVFAGMLCGIAANALFFQTARHPAPIFKGPVIARPAHPVSAPAQQSIPLPPQRPSERTAAPQSPMAPAASVARPVEAAPKDQIGALLSGGSSNASADPAPRIVAAQKALMKLGYVVKADGVMGAGTRKAIEMFEQSRKLPVTGDLSSRVSRELSALSGVAVP
ncbi:MAG: hypothetical protein JWN07_2720 [Hyphomicrobiales bacterium]|nr:hypothetical protein [Hyphomicrobiales bacterium]